MKNKIDIEVNSSVDPAVSTAPDYKEQKLAV